MKRLVLLAAAAAAVIGFGAPRAIATPPAGGVSSTTNDLLSLIPGFRGGDTRHICVVYDKLDTSYCIYIPLP